MDHRHFFSFAIFLLFFSCAQSDPRYLPPTLQSDLHLLSSTPQSEKRWIRGTAASQCRSQSLPDNARSDPPSPQCTSTGPGDSPPSTGTSQSDPHSPPGEGTGKSDSRWIPGTATWYGSPDGDGSDDGACGYGPSVKVWPFRARVGAASPFLFGNGKGCGACYKLKCLDKSICRREPTTVTIVDECPGCGDDHAHFDLGGAAFGRMGVPGEAQNLRSKGRLDVIYKRTPCKYKGKDISFRVNEGSSDYWLSIMVQYAHGDGDIGTMHIKPASSSEWIEMTHSWGANWCISSNGPLRGPFSLKIKTFSTEKIISVGDAIPGNWAPLSTYSSILTLQD